MRRRMEKINWTEHNNKLRSAGKDGRRKSPDTDTKKETKNMEPRKRQKKWNGHRLLLSMFSLFHFTHYLTLFCLTFYCFNAKKSRSWSQGPRMLALFHLTH